jgi:DNA topoisomerase I
MTELIIAEKPNAAKNIAEALSDGKSTKLNKNGVPYYQIRHDGVPIFVACAVGHLYTVAAPKKSYHYPQFDTMWVETAKVDKKSAYSMKYVKTLKELAKSCDEFTVATDYDIEGEVIGYNIIKYICKKKDANRMKFSTLTKSDLVEAYQNKQKNIDWGQANAGITRHELDWYYGINLSSALMSAIKKAGSFKVLSSGRVQGPALKLLCDKEKEIRAFKSEPFWVIQLLGDINHNSIEAWHKDDKIFDEKRADEIIKKTKTPHAYIKKKDVSQFKQMPPFPFDLTTFQIECYRVHGISPKETLSIAQELYTSGYISYPRTSSQKLPAKLGYQKLITAISKNPIYLEVAKKLLSQKTLKPNEGKKEDEAHPAIYPTGIPPGDINERSMKVYDLIVRRFLATFGEPAIRETVKATIDVNTEFFICKGTTTIFKGWHEFYGKYATFDELLLPEFNEKDPVIVREINKIDKKTQPPKRYTPASVIKELDKRNLGTKATRAQIIDNLYARGYVNNKSMDVTDLGIKTCDILEKYSPEILDEQLTRHFEEELEKIRHKDITPEDVLKEAQKILTTLLEDFKKKEKSIGEELKQAQFDSKQAAETIGKCMNCKEGNLKLRKGKFGSFIGCDNYPDCKTIYSIPKNAKITPTKKICEICKNPMIQVTKAKKFPQTICINPECSSRQTEEEKEAEEGEKAYPEEGMTCPACKKGKMILRKSFYGTFLGCNNYPKCKTMMKIVDGKVDTKAITKSGNTETKDNKKK